MDKKSLIIVESPAKAKTINKYLGKDYVVQASVGHIKNLPKSTIGVDFGGSYAPTFETIEGKQDIIDGLRDSAKKADRVYIATDPDREGEAIAADIAEEIGDNNHNIFRVLFHEITEKGVREAMNDPQKIDDHLVASQRARRVMDRIVGYKVSPWVWKTLFYGLSAGRVQSVALRLICEREEQITAFRPTEYWSIVGEFEPRTKETFHAKLFRIQGKELFTPSKENLAEIQHKGTMDRYMYIPSKDEADRHTEGIRKESFSITDIQKREAKRNPLPPFITSTLQQEASRKLNLSAKRTMMLAQKLYEGLDLGAEGLVGLITYMRTDSTRLSDDAVAAAREYIFSNYGKEYVPKHAQVYKKKKTSQDAHEAIRPTSITHTPAKVKKFLDKDLFRLYELIWNRFIACQMEAARLESTSIIVTGGAYTFKATASRYLFRGFLQLYDDAEDDGGKREEAQEEENDRLPENPAVGDTLRLLDAHTQQHETSPPPRYTESSLVKVLEALGIGRPSTYAMIVGTIINRNYVEQRERKLYAQHLGMELNRLLTANFPDIFNVKLDRKSTRLNSSHH